MKKALSLLIIALMIFAVIPFEASAVSLRSSENIIAFIKNEEGFSGSIIYYNGSAYIGYGHKTSASKYPDGISMEEADQLMRSDIRIVEDELDSFLKKYGVSLTQSQYDAVVSIAYSTGPSILWGSSPFAAILKNGPQNYSSKEIFDAIGALCHYGSTVNKGLIKRRMCESLIFTEGVYSSSAPSGWVYVIYDANGGSVANDVGFYRKGAPYGELESAVKEGFSLSGWALSSGETLLPEKIASKNETATAVWGPKVLTAAEKWPGVEILYPDVTPDMWYFDFVAKLSHDEVIHGHDDGTFRPDDSLLFCEAFKLCIKAAGLGALPRTGAHWASGYYDYAVENGIIPSYLDLGIDDEIDRLSVAIILARALNIPMSASETPFNDVDNGYVTALYEHGIIRGNGDGTFSPDAFMMRCEITSILCNLLYKDVHIGETLYNGEWVNIARDAKICPYDPDLFKTDGQFVTYESDEYTYSLGIDVSSAQGLINWKDVAESGISFAIMRAGFRDSEDGPVCDERFEKNISGAIKAGLDVGVYFYSTALKEADAVKEAEFVIKLLSDKKITLPIVFCWKPDAIDEEFSPAELNSCAAAFCDTVKRSGFSPMIYFYADIGYNFYDFSQIDNYEHWYSEMSSSPDFYYNFSIWQYSDSGSVSGVSKPVPLDIMLIPVK